MRAAPVNYPSALKDRSVQSLNWGDWTGWAPTLSIQHVVVLFYLHSSLVIASIQNHVTASELLTERLPCALSLMW